MKRHMMYLGTIAALVFSAAALGASTQDYLQQKQTNQQVTLSAVNSASQGTQSINTDLSAVSGFTTITQPINLSLYGLPGIQDSAGQQPVAITVGTGTSVGQQLMSEAFGGKRGACLMGDTRYGPPYYGGHVGSYYCYGGSSHWEFGEARLYPQTDGSVRMDILFRYHWRTVYFPMDKPYTYVYDVGRYLRLRVLYQGLVNGTVQLQGGTRGVQFVPGRGWVSRWNYATIASTSLQQAATSPYGTLTYVDNTGSCSPNCPTRTVQTAQ